MAQEMCDILVNRCFLYFILFLIYLYADGNILPFNENSINVTFCCNDMGILSVNLNNINLNDSNYEEDDPDTIILIRLLTCYIKFKKRNVLTGMISEELVLVLWHSI